MTQKKSTRAPKGQGSVYEEGPGVWVATIPVPGQRAFKVRGKDRDDAIANRQRRLDLTTQGHQAPVQVIRSATVRTVNDALDLWERSKVTARYDRVGTKIRGLEPTTVETYRYNIQHIRAGLGTERLIDLRTTRVEEWMDEMADQGVGAPSQRAALAKLRQCLKFCVSRQAETGLVQNVALGVSLPEVHRRRTPPPDEGFLRRLIAAACPDVQTEQGAPSWRIGLIVPFALATGGRRQELLALRWGDVDFDAATLTIGRRVNTLTERDANGQSLGPRTWVRSGVKMRADDVDVIDLGDTALDILRRQQRRLREIALAAMPHRWHGATDPCAPAAHIFPERDGTGAMNTRTFDTWFRRLVRPLGRPYHFHQLRHDCAGLLLSRGVPLIQVSRLLRHKRIEMTADTYSHLVPKQRQEVAAISSETVGRLLGAPSGPFGIAAPNVG